jgi:effector-binding domain-containing protein
VDPITGYRYYSYEQLPRLNRILALKYLGLSLERIMQLMNDGLSAEEIRGMLRLKRAEILQTIQEEQERLAFVELKLRQIENEGHMTDREVIIKKVDSLRVAGARGYAPNIESLGPVFKRLFTTVTHHITQNRGNFDGPGITIYYDSENGLPETNIDIESAIVTQSNLPDSEEVKIHSLPPVEMMASTIHQGSYDGLHEAYQEFMRWIEAHGYRIAGPNRELYLQFDPQGDPNKYITELQFPVEKA